MDDPFDVRRDGVVVLRLHVQPGARRTAVVGLHGGSVKVAVTAPADRGKANEAVLALVASLFDVAPSAVELVAGASARAKRVAVHDVDVESVRTVLGNVGGTGRVARRQP